MAQVKVLTTELLNILGSIAHKVLKAAGLEAHADVVELQAQLAKLPVIEVAEEVLSAAVPAVSAPLAVAAEAVTEAVQAAAPAAEAVEAVAHEVAPASPAA